MDLRSFIRSVPDFPVDGILFRDITPMLHDPVALRESIRQLAALVEGEKIDRVVGMESRGFIYGVPLAIELGCGFVPLRKPGKLPREVLSREYALEYGTASLEVHVEDIEAGERVLIVDDLLATGGTARTAADMVEKLGGEVVAMLFVIELLGLDGRGQLGGHRVESLLALPVDGD
jgi:adenine phosphoribosyltransferase